MFSVDFDTDHYQQCYDRELLPSQNPNLQDLLDFEQLFADIENKQGEVNQESFAVVYIYCFLLIFGIVCNLIILLVTVTDQLRYSSSIYIINLMVSDIIFLASLPFKIDFRAYSTCHVCQIDTEQCANRTQVTTQTFSCEEAFTEGKLKQLRENACFCPRPRNQNMFYIILFIVGYTLPLLLILASYAKIIILIRQSAKRTNSKSSKETTIISTVVGLVLSFVVCWTPFQARILFTFARYHPTDRFCFLLTEASNVFVSLNCALNPIIYGFLNRSYRKVILRKVKYVQHKLGQFVIRNMMHRNGVEGSPTETKYAQHGECFEITTELVEIQPSPGATRPASLKVFKR